MDEQKIKERILNINEVCEEVQLAKSTIYALVKKGKFRKPVSRYPGSYSKGWPKSYIDYFNQQRIEKFYSEGGMNHESH